MKISVLLLQFLSTLFSLSSEETSHKEVIILGGGVGALTSALYLSRAGFTPLVIEGKNPGGLLAESHWVENWPGDEGIVGEELTNRMYRQVGKNGAIYLDSEVVEIDLSRRPFKVKAQGIFSKKIAPFSTENLIIAMGTSPRRLNVPGEKEFWGKGVSSCVTCDGSLYKGKVVGVVGGGDHAVLEGEYLSHLAKEVNLFVRKEDFRVTEKRRLDALLKKENVHVFYNTHVEEIRGDEKGVKSVLLKTEGQLLSKPLEGLFLAIGSSPNTKLFRNQLALDSKGYIRVTEGQQCSVEGVYAIGDIADPLYQQAVTAASDGAKAAMQIQRDFSSRSAERSSRISQKQEEVIEIRGLAHFEQEVNTDLPVLVEFHAKWCRPCRHLTGYLEKGARELKDIVKIISVNVDSHREIASKYEVSSMPTLVVLKKKRLVTKIQGMTEIIDYLHSVETCEITFKE